AIRWGGWVQQGDPAPGGVGAIRKLGSKLIGTREQILEYDPPHYLAYTILTPTPMKDYRAIVSVDREGEGCRITWAASFEGRFPGAGPVMAWVLKRFIGNLVVRLARFAEQQAQS
ncbi:MAG TPA: SRPBCC family protein, partial [Mycobacteriales bacterium]|nr:SRPBCC family protein [Mycobacteriales bacterium]